MLRQCIFVATAAASLIQALPASHVVHEQRDENPARWIKRHRVSPSIKLPMRIGLTQSNLDKAHGYLMDVSHPSSPNYGKHWTPEQVIDAFQPSNETRDAVLQWLVENGIPADTIVQSHNKGWLAFHAPSHMVESLLYATYHEYEDVQTGGVLPACERYHVPASIQKHIDYIHPGIRLLPPLNAPKKEKRAIGTITTNRYAHVSLNDAQPPSYNELSNCYKSITPACIAALYHIPEATKAHHNNSMGLFEAQLQPWDQEELNIFFSNYAPRIPNGTHPIDHDIDGGFASTKNATLISTLQAVEVAGDLDISYPIVYPQTITIFNTDDKHYQAWPNDTYTWGFNTLLDAIDGSYCTYAAYGEKGNLPGVDPTYPDPGRDGYNHPLQCGVFKPTNVISLSYGGNEYQVPISYQRRQCNEYLKLGLQGVTFLFASGDAGVGDYPADTGAGTSGPTGCLGPNYDIYNPTWPGGCPYVTSVGGTQINQGSTVNDPESAFFQKSFSSAKLYNQYGKANYTSGGGFSNIFAPAKYQQKAIETYFAQHDPRQKYYSKLAKDDPSNPYLWLNITELAGNTGGVYNRIGRGHPDVSAVGKNLRAVFFGNVSAVITGTSGAAPAWGGIITRINDERLAKGKKPVGFINPLLYQHPEVLNDITTGNNSGCYQPGFQAVPGWDPVTGLGTPNYPKMLDLWLGMP